MKIKEVTLNDLNEVILSEKKLFKEELRINQKELVPLNIMVQLYQDFQLI